MHAATGDIVVTLDAHGSADPCEIPAFVEALVDGADFALRAVATRPDGSAPPRRRRSGASRAPSAAPGCGTALSAARWSPRRRAGAARWDRHARRRPGPTYGAGGPPATPDG